MIRVRPSKENRKEFAKWAVANKVKTVTSNDFHVPANIFNKIPEKLLLNSLVDSLPYVPDSVDCTSSCVETTQAPLIINDPEDEKELEAPKELKESEGNQDPEGEDVQVETTSSTDADSEPEFTEGTNELEFTQDGNVDETDNLYCSECEISFDDFRGLEIHQKFKH